MILDDSVIILNKIIAIIAHIFDFKTAIGSIIIIRMIFIISYVMFVTDAGSMFSFPCKNPLCILEIVINGRIKTIDVIALYKISLWSIFAIVLEDNNINIIIIISIIKPIK